MEEARIQAEHIYSPNYKEYAVWGCGLLYHVYQLWQISDESIHIRVYEDNKELIEIAKKYGPFEKIPEEIEIISDNGVNFVSSIDNDDTGIWMHLASIKKINEIQTKNAMMRFFMAWNGNIQLKRSLDINFRRNTRICVHNIIEKKEEFYRRDVAIVAGGPSVDDSLDLLRGFISNNMIVIAVNTIVKKLLNERIVPDYIAVMDCHSRTYKHIEGVQCDKECHEPDSYR